MRTLSQRVLRSELRLLGQSKPGAMTILCTV